MPEDGRVHDAERLPWRRVTENALPTRHPRVWVRVDGVWCRGAVVYWQRDSGGWAVWTQHELPEQRNDWTWHEWFRYDPETMRPRTGDEPPESESK